MTENNTPKIKVQAIPAIHIHPRTEVTFTRQGERHAEVLYTMRKAKPNIKKLNKDEYVIISGESAGEIRRYKHQSDKMRESLRRTFRDLEGLIKTNFDAADPHQKFITLTYRRNMKDHEQLYSDFKVFFRKLQRHVGSAYPLEYIVVMEPQARGAWHAHLMLKSSNPGLWIDARKLTELWGHGITDIAQLKGDDVGLYYTAYFTSLIAETTSKDGIDHGPASKRRIKGGRLHFYPPGMKFYRCSRGIARPMKGQAEYRAVQDEYGTSQRTTTYAVIKGDDDSDDDYINVIQRESYRRDT